MLYEALKPIVGIALRWYYRSVLVANGDRIPRDGPVFLAANHPNALTDAMVVGWTSPRRVRFTAKATLFGHPLAARILHAIGVIPLRRAADERARDASGRSEPHDLAASMPDATRNASSFAAVADALAEDACIVLFPEGKTHDEPAMAPMRTGLARMALMGEPIDLDGIGSGPSTVATLTELIDQRLRAVTLNFESHADAERIQLLSQTLVALVEPTTDVGEGAPPLARTLATVRRIERAQTTLRARGGHDVTARIDAFERRLRAFREQLARERINVHDLAIDLSTRLGARFVVREVAMAAALLPVVLWGRATHLLPLRLARYIALRNVRSLDEPPMRTFVVGLVLVLATYVVGTVAVWRAVGPWWALLFLVSLVPSASLDVRYSDRMRRARARARAYRRFRATPALLASLKADAEFLQSEAGALEQLASG